MRIRQIFIALILVFSTQGFSGSTVTPNALASAGGSGVSAASAPSAPSVKAQVDLEMQGLLQGLGMATSVEDRMKMLARFELVAKGIREHSARQPEEDEIYLDTLFGMLAEIPRNKHFKKGSCSEYGSRLKFDYDPTAEGSSEDPAVDAGLKILAALCS